MVTYGNFMALWRANRATPPSGNLQASLLGGMEGYLSWIICHVGVYPAGPDMFMFHVRNDPNVPNVRQKKLHTECS